jgi:hypothetical protein
LGVLLHLVLMILLWLKLSVNSFVGKTWCVPSVSESLYNSMTEVQCSSVYIQYGLVSLCNGDVVDKVLGSVSEDITEDEVDYFYSLFINLWYYMITMLLNSVVKSMWWSICDAFELLRDILLPVVSWTMHGPYCSAYQCLHVWTHLYPPSYMLADACSQICWVDVHTCLYGGF